MKTNRQSRRVYRCKKSAKLSGRAYSVIVVRSNKACEVHLVGRTEGRVLCGLTSRGDPRAGAAEGALRLGERFAAMLVERGVREVHFNRMGLKYHGRVAAVVQGLRNGGVVC